MNRDLGRYPLPPPPPEPRCYLTPAYRYGDLVCAHCRRWIWMMMPPLDKLIHRLLRGHWYRLRTREEAYYDAQETKGRI